MLTGGSDTEGWLGCPLNRPLSFGYETLGHFIHILTNSCCIYCGPSFLEGDTSASSSYLQTQRMVCDLGNKETHLTIFLEYSTGR